MPASTIFDLALIRQLLADLSRANTEAACKERFIQWLAAAFSSDKAAQELISQMSLGAERTIANIPRGTGTRTGRADTQTQTLLIEWEKDLDRTGEHAKEQLSEYLVGNWNSGDEYRYVLVATDGIEWRIYAPEWGELIESRFTERGSIRLREIRKFVLTEDTLSEFPFFLDETLFVSSKKTPTLDSIQRDFGDTSPTFFSFVSNLLRVSMEYQESTEFEVAYNQWKRFLSVAYGKFDQPREMFLVHTYLSAFAKMIAYAVLTDREPIALEGIQDVISGKAFDKLNVERFVENDFFHWVASDRFYNQLQPAFRRLARTVGEYEFSSVNEDILKGVYQELIDLETRHALGEYYTPDWLCEHIVRDLRIDEKATVLDPACGSGSFLRAVIAEKKKLSGMTATIIAEQVVGIDIHPLSVQIAKTTILLALGDLVRISRKPVVLNVYLANSLLVPEESTDLLGTRFRVTVDNKSYFLTVDDFSKPAEFDRLITFCDEVIDRFGFDVPSDRFTKMCRDVVRKEISGELARELHAIYRGLAQARQTGRDSIWSFILQNSYKPVFLRGRFDVVVGNPPWLTYSDVQNEDYQGLLKSMAVQYGVLPERRANMPHLEIAAIFLAHSVNYFLSENGRLAFVLPRAFLTADQHHNLRAGEIHGMHLSEVWDLDGVSPLFRVPSCVLMARRAISVRDQMIGDNGLEGLRFAGKLPQSQIHWSVARKYLKETEQHFHYSELRSDKGRIRSAITSTKLKGAVGSNAYADRFSQGATIVPRSFYFVQLESDSENFEKDLIVVRSSEEALMEAKAPWKEFSFRGRIERKFFFQTALARNVLPFTLFNPVSVVLPVQIVSTGEGARRRYELLDAEQVFRAGGRYASKWFQEAEETWNKYRTDRAQSSGLSHLKRLDYQRGITHQDPDARFLVIYTASGQDACAAVVDRTAFDPPFIADCKTYWCAVSTEKEAHYLCAFLNSNFANNQIKEFQSRGLYGARDIHTTIVMLPLQKFSSSLAEHLEVSQLSEKLSKEVSSLLGGLGDKALSARKLGTIRAQVRKQFDKSFYRIDEIFASISNTELSATRKTTKSRGKKSTSGRLFDD